jgi:Amidohydrolase family
MKTLLIAALLLAATPASRSMGQDVLIRGATVHTASAAGTLKSADVLIRGGAISAVGSALSAPGATVIEAKGRPLTPGLFGGLTTLGVEEVSAEPQSVDSTLESQVSLENQQWRPEFDVTLAFNPRSMLVPVARVEGITWTVLAPGTGNSIIAGEGAGMTLDGRFDAVLRSSRSLFVQMGSDGARITGHTRAAEYMLLDQAIREARSAAPTAPGALLHPAGREVLARYLAGGRVVFAVDRASDILQTLAFAKRNTMKPVIWGGAEAWVVAKELAQADVPVVINPLNDLPAHFDSLAASLDNAVRLHRAGVRLIFSDGDASRARLARQLAGNAVAHGLPWDAALAAITANPAAVFGIGATHGHIAVGQAADLVLWSADPLELSSLADQVWIAGRPVEMRSRQTELRDRYAAKVKAHQAR